MKRYITKWVQTTGILFAEVKITDNGTFIKHKSGQCQYISKNHVHTSLAAAQAMANKVLRRKLANLEKQVEAMRAAVGRPTPVMDLNGRVVSGPPEDAAV